MSKKSWFEKDQDTLRNAFGYNRPTEETRRYRDQTNIIINNSNSQNNQPILQQQQRHYSAVELAHIRDEKRKNIQYRNGIWGYFFRNLKTVFLSKYILIPIILSSAVAYLAWKGNPVKHDFLQSFIAFTLCLFILMALGCYGLACLSSSRDTYN